MLAHFVPIVVVLDHTIGYLDVMVAVVMVGQQEVIPVVMVVQTVGEMAEEEEMAAGVGVVINEKISTIPSCHEGSRVDPLRISMQRVECTGSFS